ncbi:hypothetical protein PLESTB_001593300 [Pleodorina starrii]|uniref:Protein-S-isoprenylcysteine O-methyltransferase n=1 Tax=Pleodorina starrii TaxID=330485 RepID=A0A9W6BYN6_9CHLO|nr:hypothetical protein PLESTM_000577700 [Pleodorina starrii]GLC60275.1 hypothetical protein PLESTB_001593300 [Pleodorina starrii]GLC66037.1 hypothetical protein PLESTF_000374900 [Pleodorina starrii]
MQSCLICRSVKAGLPGRGLSRRPITVPRPVVFAGSVSTPEPSPGANESAKAEPQAEQPQQPQTESPATINVEITAVSKAAEEEAQLRTSGGETSGGETSGGEASGGEEREEREEATAAGPSSSLAAHPLEDVPEEEDEDIIASKELVAEVLDGSAFGKRGEQWLVAQLAAIGMLMFPPLTLKGLVDFCATLALTTGLVFMATSFFNLGRNISPLPEPRKKHRLVVSGIYGYVRHPMYGGLLLAGFGLAVLTRNETRLAILALLWWVLENKVSAEEKALSIRYPEYAEYKAKVKKFLPFLY